jgi:diguanylate cyclase (GGDEF)-like protein
MGFRVRLVAFLLAILVVVQGLTWLLVFEVTRHESIAAGERQLTSAAGVFVNQLDDISLRIANSVQVLALDYALRESIAQHDRATVLSALRNHGRRVGAARMLLMNLDGRITADTGTAEPDGRPTGSRALFPFPELLNGVLEHPVAAVVAMDGHAYWMVVVTVNAPQPLALIAAGIPIDDRLLANMQRLSTLPKNIELIASTDAGPWKVVARGDHHVPLSAPLLRDGKALPAAPVLVKVDGREYVALARPFGRSPGNVAMAVVIGYSLDEALGPFRSVTATWLLLVLLGLAVGAVGAWLIARGVARPLEELAASAARIAGGDYTPPPPPRRRDELAHLANAFTRMLGALREREERIRFQAEHDAITGMPNRLAAEAIVQRDLASARHGGALLMIGLARFPDIVKTMGHTISDRLMHDASGHLQTLAPGQLVARATDSQLLLWLPDAGRSEAITLAFRVRDALARPWREADLSIDAAPAIGIALHPQHGADASALLQHAEVALFAALGHEDPVALYEPTTDPHRPARLALMGELRQALDGDQLSMAYQPRLEIAASRIEGVEGLVRWVHPLHGPLGPDEFVPLAEKTGNIRQLTRWVLASGIAQLRRWMDEGRTLRLALNLSARDLDDVELPQRVAALLAAHDVPAQRLVLEVTESAVMAEPDAALKVLQRLADQGIDIAIDDFGVGQSSLTYLRRLPVRELKIDKSFVARLGEDREDQAIVRAIVDLGHRLGFRVVAEGVEDPAALDYLREIGCDFAQGFFIARPLTTAALRDFLDPP